MVNLTKKFNPSAWWKETYRFPSVLDLENLHDFTKKRSGWVYAVQSTDHMDWGFKVGMTKRNPYLRAKELASAGSPYRLEVISAVFVLNAPWAEKRCHQSLAKFHSQKEWFKCTQEEVLEALNAIQSVEQSMLSRFFNVDLLVNSSKLTFVSQGFYPDEMISN